MKVIKPYSLSEGDKIGICAPSGIVREKEILDAKTYIEGHGFQVVLGSHVFESYRFFSSTVENRVHDFQDFLDNDEIKAIYCARGGFGASKMVDHLDFSQIRNSPKWIVGFSDITVLHLKLMKEGVISLHGPVARQLIKDNMGESIRSVFDVLKTGTGVIEWSTKFREEINIEGRIIGGNLSMLVNSIGTKTDFDLNDKILFIEDVGEHIYRIDRLLNQLQRSEKLKNLKALLIGDFSRISETDPEYGISVYQLIYEYLDGLDYPVIGNLPVGHELKNMAIMQNSMASLSVAEGIAILKMS